MEHRSPNIDGTVGTNNIITAIKQHNAEMVSVLIQSGANVNESDPETGATPLHIAVFEEQPKIVELLLNNGASPQAQTCDGSTPLHWIGTNDYDLVSELLVNAGASLNVQNNEGWTPLHNMVHRFNMNRVRFLLTQGADPNLQNNEGNTPLHEVVRDSGYFLIELLLEAGADPLIKNKAGHSAKDLAKNPSFLIDYKRNYYIDKNGNSSV
jgi:ankyrin repeat protein